ncbi:hypothetical protein C8R47DRAFT_1223612 [Mycena vitilis]|nr:hypothetical protein C8R47DRAFT_1223612 [Mycena vitilis]
MPATRTSSTRPRRSLRLQSVPADSMLSSRPSRSTRTTAIPQRFQQPPSPRSTTRKRRPAPQKHRELPPTADAEAPHADAEAPRLTPPVEEPKRVWFLNRFGQMSPCLYTVEVGPPAGQDVSQGTVVAAYKTTGIEVFLPRCSHLRHLYKKGTNGQLKRTGDIYFVVWGCNIIFKSLERAWQHWESHRNPHTYITAVASRAQAEDIIDTEHDDISACGSTKDCEDGGEGPHRDDFSSCGPL